MKRLGRTFGSLFEPLENRTMFSSRVLDPSFSGDGRATVDFGGGLKVNAEAAAVQTDGKTVVAGTTADERLAVARFNLDGSLDTAFGANDDGKVLTQFGGGGRAHAQSLLIDTAGRILVGGFLFTPAGSVSDQHALIARYLPSGALDPSFGNSSSHLGVTVTDFGGLPYCTVQDMAIAPGGNIIVAGHGYKDTTFNLNSDMMVASLKDDGHTDSSFGDGGHKFLLFGAEEDGQALAVDQNGSPQSNPLFGTIVVVGRRYTNAQNFNGPRTIAIARLKANGSYDTTFDKDGQKLVTLPGQASAEATGVVIQPDGKMVVSATAEQILHGKQRDFAVLRLLSDGPFDGTFGGANTGINITNVNGDDVSTDMIQSSDGGLLVGGKAGGKFAIVKYTADGRLDSGFGSNGIVATDDGGVQKLRRGPGRRFVAVGGAGLETHRYLDAGANLVFASAFLAPATTEGGQDSAGFYVFRSERLPIATRVYLNVGGTATSPLVGGFPIGQADYTGIQAELPTFGKAGVSAIGGLAPFGGGSNVAFVDIKAGDTFAFVTITPIDDTRFEGDETATFTVKANGAYEVGTPNVVELVIHDNDGVVLGDTADAFVRDGTAANTNFGTSSELQVKNNTGGTTRQAFMKFDLTNVDLAKIGTVTLKVFGQLNNTNQTNVATQVFGSNDTGWSETAITFNNKPQTDTAALASATVIDTTPRWYTFDITAYVKAQKAAGRNVITLALKNPASSDPFVSFASRESGINAPQLGVAFA